MSGAETKTEVFTVTDVGEPVAEKDTRTNRKRSIFERYVQPCLAELFGTGLFVFVGCASVVGNTGTAGIIQPALAHGLALGVMIQIFGQISGGHFNPAVSLCAYLCGGMELLLLGPYVVAQMLGGMVGAGLSMGVFPLNVSDASLGGAFDVTNKDLAAATLAEVIMTAFLTMVVCMAAINGQTRSQLAPLCIGLTVTANIFAGGPVSGACMNPARAFGPAVVNNHWDHHWVYWVGPVCGALCTTSLIRLLFGDHKTRVVFK
ncbi:aquaporin-8a.1 [Sparus aurata]|uniref:Aquaporin 8a, tandem duplicate 1 n=1 Tax=Sparus aurata TaxID=8175 RepID=A0A671VJJ7_SPAAU|nr:aquaporin-8-like [Sparus aurata]